MKIFESVRFVFRGKKKNQHTFVSRKFHKVVKNAVNFLDNSPSQQLPLSNKFVGSGVYALYYKGSFDLYAELSRQYADFSVCPIYVGRAVPKGWRTARTNNGQKSFKLYDRILEHVNTIRVANNLDLNDFECQYMILEPDLIAPVEAELIRHHQPLWNCVIEGFGNHNVGKTRFEQARPAWDIIHPGRAWAARMTGPVASREQVVYNIKKTLGLEHCEYSAAPLKPEPPKIRIITEGTNPKKL